MACLFAGRRKSRTASAVLVCVVLALSMVDASAEDDLPLCNEFWLPFNSFRDRRCYASLRDRRLDGFGAYRSAGHRHAGLDIAADLAEPVYPIGRGSVLGLYYRFPNEAVIIQHRLADGAVIYSSYVHLGEIYVSPGDLIDPMVPIGRTFNAKELLRADFDQNHLHLEIRKTMDDDGVASYSCENLEELHSHFYDPEVFLHANLGHR